MTYKNYGRHCVNQYLYLNAMILENEVRQSEQRFCVTEWEKLVVLGVDSTHCKYVRLMAAEYNGFETDPALVTLDATISTHFCCIAGEEGEQQQRRCFEQLLQHGGC